MALNVSCLITQGVIVISRFAVVLVLFIIAVFGFFIGWGVSSYMLDLFGNALIPLAPTEADNIINLLEFAFGIICAIILVVIVVVFFIESLSDEPEHYFYRGPYG